MAARPRNVRLNFRMSIAISEIGLATAQGSTAEILESKALHPPAGLPWTANNWNVSKICYSALDKKAFADLGELSSNTPLLVASCNGDASQSWEQAFDTTALLAGTPWAHERLPVFSSSCASGIHALYAARQLLTAGIV